LDKDGCAATFKRLALNNFHNSSVIKDEFRATGFDTERQKGCGISNEAPEKSKEKYYYSTDVYRFGSTMAEIFFGINIEYGKRMKEFLEIGVDTELEKGIKKILEKCLKELP
jgi:hypothetical protein